MIKAAVLGSGPSSTGGGSSRGEEVGIGRGTGRGEAGGG
jgi:hypothetical protein